MRYNYRGYRYDLPPSETRAVFFRSGNRNYI